MLNGYGVDSVEQEYGFMKNVISCWGKNREFGQIFLN